MTAEQKTEVFGEELEMVWILDDEDRPSMRHTAVFEMVNWGVFL
jgi:hypothetical protein